MTTSSSDTGEREKLFEKYYILTPLDLNFNIHQCIYMDDSKLPAWKLFGNLPLIDIVLTDEKLEQIIKLTKSIPLPASKTYNDLADVTESIVANSIYENLDETLNGNLIETLNVLSSSSGNDNSDSNKKKNNFYSKSDEIQQSIDLEFSFEINNIYFTLKEQKPTFFDAIIFKISSFGAFIQNKTYDTNINIYLNQVECEYVLLNDTDGTKLYIIKSQDKRSSNILDNRLVDIEILQTDTQSPTLSLLHNNVLNKIDIKLSSLDFVLNLIAVRNMIQFLDKFQENIEKNLVETVNNTEKTQQLQQQKVKNSPNMPLLNDNQIIHLLFKKSTGINPKMKILTNSNLIELKLNAKMDGIRARVSTRKQNYFLINVNNFEVNLKSKSTEKNIELILNSISVQDLDTTAIYKNIVSLKENTDNLIHINLVMFNSPPISDSKLANKCQSEKFYFKNYLNEDYFDLIVTANISKLRLMFLYKHLNTVLVNLYPKKTYFNYFMNKFFLKGLAQNY